MKEVDLASELAATLGCSLPELQPLEGGLDYVARNYGSGTYFIKVRPDVPGGVTLTSELAIPGVLAPLHIVKLSDGTKAIIYPFIAAKNGFEQPLLLHHWEQVGWLLRQVHEFAGLTSGLSRETFVVPDIDTLETSPLAHLIEFHRSQVNWLIEETQELGNRFAKRPWRLVPCHADLHVGNILTSGNQVWLVDWDTARLAPRECDLLFFLGSGILGLHGPEEEAAFLEGYGKVDYSTDLIRYFQLARVLEDVVSFAKQGDQAWLSRQFEANSLLHVVRSSESV